MNTRWDPLHLAYFNGYAMWTYLTTPFFMAMPGFKVTEISPWQEGGESWRGLRVRFPDDIASHSKEQDFYYGDDFLLRRHDYHVDVAGGFAAHNMSTTSWRWRVSAIQPSALRTCADQI